MEQTLRTLHRADHKSVRIQDGFWSPKMEQIHTVTVWDVLNKFESDHEEGIMKNFEWMAEGKLGKHIGPPWYDGLICEVIRGISDIIATTYDEKLDQKIEYYAGMIQKAQDADPEGYLNTYTTLICPDQRMGQNGGSLIWQHDLYNIGCLVEAGVHYYRATGKICLLKCSIRAAGYLCKEIGPEPRKNIVPAHPLPEEAMVKLYVLLKDETLCARLHEEGLEVTARDYLDLAQFWMDHRGVHHNRASNPRYMGEYAQDHCPVTEQSEAVGHAVRATLLYTGLTAVGMETGEQKYLDTVKRLWENVVQTKLHISGGIGAVHNEERFGFQYDLPNDAYLETCAGVAMAFWAGEMHAAFGDASYMDVFECALYNNVLPGLSEDGTHYFYENPLISDGSIERWNWHGCPCCPPMFLKLMSSLQDYIYSTANNRLYVNLHIGSTYAGQVDGTSVTVTQKNNALPWEGHNEITVSMQEAKAFALMVRIPAWAGKTTVTLNGRPEEFSMEKGYLCIDRTWQDGDALRFTMAMPAVKIEAHPYVDADAGRVALQRGPILYCLEEIDNPNGVDVLLGHHTLQVETAELFGDKKIIRGLTQDEVPFTAIPYYWWNNRGKGKMNVWLRQMDGDQTEADYKKAHEQSGFAAHTTMQNPKKRNLQGWEGKLYRAYQSEK